MTALYVTVAALFFLMMGMAICLLGFYLYAMMQQVKQLRASVDGLIKSSGDLLNEGSFGRMSRSLVMISTEMPGILVGIKEFSRVMSIFSRNAFQPESPEPTVVAGKDGESAFYPYSESNAASNEAAAEARKHGINLSEEELAGMRTDNR